MPPRSGQPWTIVPSNGQGLFNPNGGPDGGFGTANIITDGIGRRRLQLGAKIIF